MKYIATGRVHPERADVTFGPVRWHIPARGSVAASCESSQLTVSLDLPEIDGFISAYIVAEQFAYIAVGALGFALGTGYSCELIQVIEEGGAPHVFGVRPSYGPEKATLGFADHQTTLQEAFSLATKDVYFRLALRDYLRAITDAQDCATYCYRAIESLKTSLASAAGDRSWSHMHSALGTDEDTITKLVKDFADPIRHGNWTNARASSVEDRWQMLKLTRDILFRYLERHRMVA